MSNLHLRTIYLLPLMVATSLLVFAGSGHIFTSGKLSSSLINCVTQDHYGYVWVGTEYGLNKFDGYNFTTYLYKSTDPNTITDNTITDFLVDRSGRLWIGSAKGLMRYDYHHDNFVRYPFPDGRRPRVYSLIENRKGDILIGSAGFGLYAVRRGTDKVIHETEYTRRDSGEFFTHIYEDRHGYLWQSSHVSLFTRFVRSGHRVIAHDYTSPVGAPVAFFPRRDGRLLIVCMGGIMVYDYATDRLSDAGYDFGRYAGHITINAATFDKHGKLLVGTSESGVLVAAPGKRTFVPYTLPTDDGFDITTSYAKDLMLDKDYNLWVGCYRKGLYLVNDHVPAFASWSFSKQNYSIGSSVSSLARGDDGTTWCTVQNSGVFQFNADGRIKTHLPAPSGTSIIYRDGQGHYWVGTGNGLYSYDITTGSAVKKMSYASDGTYCIADDGHGTLFVSVYSKGLYVYNTQTAQVRVFNQSQRRAGGYLCNDWIRSMTVDHTGLLWIGTSNGVTCLNPKTMSFRTFGDIYFLHDIQTNYLREDPQGNILIGTDNGLYVFLRKKRKVVAFPGAAILRGKQICGIAIDHSGDLWISTTMGIWQYDQKRRKFLGHVSGNGLMSREYTQGAVLHDTDDRISFGTGDGITTFYPNNVRNRRMDLSKVFLTGFIVDGKTMDCLSDNFTIPYSENTFTLRFSLLNYKNPANIYFQYRINGGEWTLNSEGDNALTFTKLQPGKYVIDVRAYDNGVCSEKIRTITIHVKEPWYLSPLAIVLYFLAVAGIAVFAFLFYTRMKKTELEESKMRFLIDATHDIKSPLTLILGPLNRLKERLAHDEENQKYIKIIDHNARRLLLLVNQILDERRLDKNQLTLQCATTDLVGLIRGVCSMFQFNATQRHITLAFDHDEAQVHAWVDAHNFEKVIVNLLSNAFKYTPDGGEIHFRLFRTKDQIVIQLTDTGPGFKPQELGHVFDRFYQGHRDANSRISGTGIGLNLCHAIVVMHGGTITAANRSNHQHGAQMEVRLPEYHRDMAIEKQSTASSPSAPHSQGNRHIRVMLVDDDSELTQYIARELRQWYRFELFTNGRDAMQALLQQPADIVVSDIVMPVMDGIALLKEIKGNTLTSDIPVVLLTSKSEAEDRLQGLSLGANAYLEKPFSMDELHAVIDNLVDNIRLLRGKYSGARDQTNRLETPKIVGNDELLMERIMKSVNAHLADSDFNVEILTQEVGISRAQLHRKLKEITGVSTADFIRNLRLQRAAEMLAEGKVGVTQVAYDVGFGSQSHFSTVFRRHFGVSPRDYAAKRQDETNTNVREI